MDFIHLSNIFDYVSYVDAADTLRKLMRHTNPGCVICMVGYHRSMLYLCDKVVNGFVKKNPEQSWKYRKIKKSNRYCNTYFMTRVR